jgi:hypothetical protein
MILVPHTAHRSRRLAAGGRRTACSKRGQPVLAALVPVLEAGLVSAVLLAWLPALVPVLGAEPALVVVLAWLPVHLLTC